MVFAELTYIIKRRNQMVLSIEIIVNFPIIHFSNNQGIYVYCLCLWVHLGKLKKYQNSIFIGQCDKYLLDKVFYHLLKTQCPICQNNTRFFALSIICPIIFIYMYFCPSVCLSFRPQVISHRRSLY